MTSLFEEIARLQREGQPCALCTIVKTAGSTPSVSSGEVLGRALNMAASSRSKSISSLATA